MGHTKCISNIKLKILFFAITLINTLSVWGQHYLRPPVHRFDRPYYQVGYFSDDSLAYDMGIGYLSGKRVIPLDFEEEKCAALDNFGIVNQERCDWMRISDSNKELVRLTVRCQFARDLNFITFPSTPDHSKITDSLCVSACDEFYFPVGEDSVATIIWDVMPSISVYQLKLKGRKAYLDHFLGTTSSCGLFELEVPTDTDAYYVFYITEDYVVWLRFFGTHSLRHVVKKRKL